MNDNIPLVDRIIAEFHDWQAQKNAMRQSLLEIEHSIRCKYFTLCMEVSR